MAITSGFVDTRIPGDTRFVIEFASVPGKTYTIIYSSDLVTLGGRHAQHHRQRNITQWYDDGPPKTDSKPSSVPAAFLPRDPILKPTLIWHE